MYSSFHTFHALAEPKLYLSSSLAFIPRLVRIVTAAVSLTWKKSVSGQCSTYSLSLVEPTLDASLALITRLVEIVTVAVSLTWKKSVSGQCSIILCISCLFGAAHPACQCQPCSYHQAGGDRDGCCQPHLEKIEKMPSPPASCETFEDSGGGGGGQRFFPAFLVGRSLLAIPFTLLFIYSWDLAALRAVLCAQSSY